MNFPLVGILSSACAALGIYGLVWYYSLSEAQREEADRLACLYAQQLYQKTLDQLTRSQVSRVYELVKTRFIG